MIVFHELVSVIRHEPFLRTANWAAKEIKLASFVVLYPLEAELSVDDVCGWHDRLESLAILLP